MSVLVLTSLNRERDGDGTYTVVSGHLGTPTVDDLVVTEEKDGSVTSLEARVGPLFDG